MNNYDRIDAFDINFVDSAARNEFKLKTSTGMGESRIYIGSDEKRYDEFFEFENVEYFFTKKNDLVQYLKDSEPEYLMPTQDYRNNISDYYHENVDNTNAIDMDIIKFDFHKKYDDQKRYYLVLNEDGNNRKNYSFIRNICLPRVTKYCFIKIKDKITQKKYIYMRPIFFNDLFTNEVEIMYHEAAKEELGNGSITKEAYRKKQAQYRDELLKIMPFDPFTFVADDRILVACHIKPYSVCNEEERYDPKNGIIMTPTYHTLFDMGFISFENNGQLLVSPFLTNVTKDRLNLIDGKKLRIQTGSDKYLEYHRKHIFCQMPTIKAGDLVDSDI
jgi:putative restriction endonuclease